MSTKGTAKATQFSEPVPASVEPLLRPLSLIGRHMLAVFSMEICLSVLLIGHTESGLTIEPLTSVLVISQLLTAPLFAWFLEWRSVAKQSARPIRQATQLAASSG